MTKTKRCEDCRFYEGQYDHEVLYHWVRCGLRCAYWMEDKTCADYSRKWWKFWRPK